MIPGAGVVLLIGAAMQDPVGAQAAIPVQLGVSLSADTLTVGERFIAVIRVRAPRGATIEFPQKVDSSSAASATAMQLVGTPVTRQQSDSAGTIVSTAYRFAAWDIGQQQLSIGSIRVVAGNDTGYISLADRGVFVRSVLPADSNLRVPKPARAPLGLPAFDWRPLLIAALALAGAMLLWRAWMWYRDRKERMLDPFSVAELEFARVEAMQLIHAGQQGQHAALMSDVLRVYLASRIDGIERSQTSSELLANAGGIRAPAQGLGELLWRTDLIKFANNTVEADEAERLGASARVIVRAVEDSIVQREKAAEKRAA